MKDHSLQGLEPDNLLAFLALLGFHRALDHAVPEWKSRVYWSGMPLRPVLVLAQDAGRSEVLDAAARGCDALSAVHSFGTHKDIDYSWDEARMELQAACLSAGPADRLKADLLSALMSDGAVKDDKSVRATPFCAMFGQGHQHFLERLESVPYGKPPKELAKTVKRADLNSAAMLERALFRAWERADRTQSFRWDPLEDRRYALRYEDPSTEKGLTVHGANRLASLALPLLTAIPRRERGEIRLHAIGTSWEKRAGVCVRWPVWHRPATLRAVVLMLAICGGGDTMPAGVIRIYQSERISVGKFFNFTRAVPPGTSAP